MLTLITVIVTLPKYVVFTENPVLWDHLTWSFTGEGTRISDFTVCGERVVISVLCGHIAKK